MVAAMLGRRGWLDRHLYLAIWGCFFGVLTVILLLVNAWVVQ